MHALTQTVKRSTASGACDGSPLATASASASARECWRIEPCAPAARGVQCSHATRSSLVKRRRIPAISIAIAAPRQCTALCALVAVLDVRVRTRLTEDASSANGTRTSTESKSVATASAACATTNANAIERIHQCSDAAASTSTYSSVYATHWSCQRQRQRNVSSSNSCLTHLATPTATLFAS